MQRLEDCLSFVLDKAAQTVARRLREHLAPHGVTPVQYAMLNLLWERDGQSAAELGTRLLLDSATLTGIIDRLQAAALVSRQPDPEDRRVNRVFLTGSARALYPTLDQEVDRVNQVFVAKLGKGSAAFSGQLRKIAELGAKAPQRRGS